MLSVHGSMASTRFVTRQLGRASRMQSGAMEKLSSGFRINKASDDPSGLLISEQLRSQIDGLQRAVRNTEDAGSLMDIMDGGLAQVQELLKKMQTLAIHAANQGVSSPGQIAADQAEMDNALIAINNIFNTTEYGGRKLLNSTDLFSNGGNNVNAPAGNLTGGAGSEILNRDYTFVIKGEGENGGQETTLTFTKGQSLDEVLEALRKVDPSSTLGADSEDEGEDGSVAFGATVKLNATSLENLKNLSDDEAKQKLSGMMKRAMFQDAGMLEMDGDYLPEGSFGLGEGIEFGDLLGELSPKDKELLEISDMLGGLNLGSLGTVMLGEDGERLSGYSLQDLFSGGAASLSRDPALALKILQEAHDQIGMTRASIGASQAYQDHAKAAQEIALENLTRSESGIRDADMAENMVEFTKAKILMQVGTQMLSSIMDNSKQVLDLFA